MVANAIETDKYGFSESNRRKIREKLGISGDALVVGHVGRFQVQKNHEAILRIFHEIQRKEPAARLCLIGDGELKEQIQEQAKKAGVLDKIIFTGVCQDVERYLSAMDVFLFPSLFEGLDVYKRQPLLLDVTLVLLWQRALLLVLSAVLPFFRHWFCFLTSPLRRHSISCFLPDWINRLHLLRSIISFGL